jgi:2-C-methyl-D-erythritol 4-phosphate cytidylyltransferase/2-C-methyl-D-erythritol 2,4-cyclodiphosphate synthase
VKQLRALDGVPLAVWAARAFASHPEVDEVVCAVPAGLLGEFAGLLLPLSPKIRIVAGGAARSESVSLALAALDPACGTILVHDGVRPFVSAELISRVRAAVLARGPAVAAVRLADTLKEGEAAGPARQPAGIREAAPPAFPVKGTVPREGLWRAQTPQGFPRGALEEALAAARAGGGLEAASDEALLLERAGREVWLVEGDELNMKITTPRDLALAELVAAGLRARGALGGVPGPGQGVPGAGGGADGRGPGDAGSPAGGPSRLPALRVGQGFDFHAFAGDGRPLFLCCLHFPGERGLLGHSDADVAVHALVDAILGAAGLGDIGGLFPDTDPRHRGAPGRALLEGAWKLAARRFDLVNADLTIIGERPRVAGRRGEMAEALAAAMGCDPARVNVKATTTERLGFLGRGEGLAAAASVLLAGRQGLPGG